MTTEMRIGSNVYTVTNEFAEGVNAMLQGYLKEHIINEALKPKRQVLLITVDGVEIHMGDVVPLYRVCVNDWTTMRLEGCAECISYDQNNYKWFFAEEEMQEWIEYNKPCLSQKEVIEEVITTTEVMRGMKLPQDHIEAIKCHLDNYVMEKLRDV
jgi:hypothetical protein